MFTAFSSDRLRIDGINIADAGQVNLTNRENAAVLTDLEQSSDTLANFGN
jgi:hypothetical protein